MAFVPHSRTSPALRSTGRPRTSPAGRRWTLFCLSLALAMAAALLGAPAATAEVQHPRQQWMRESTAGLFLHWGMFTAPRHVDCEAWEHDVTAGGWTADYWVDEARKLGASYIVLATFHSRLGYARPWPSKIPGSCSTERDFLGELVNAGKAKGIKVMLYMTDDPQWHNEVPGVQTLDSDAYSAYKGEKIDLTTREGFGRFSYDQFFEVMENYPDLAGFWIDNDNEYWENHHLYEQIRAKRPSWLLTNNNEDTPIMDTVSNEQKTGMTPAYDYPSAAFTPMPRISEGDYKLPTSGDWWYDGKDHPVDFRLSTGRYITNAGSSMKSLMAETAMVNGRFPPSQQEYNDFMADWTAPIRSSLQGTEGGGYMYGGMQPGFWNDGAHGVVTVGPGARTQYVHVVTRPGTDLVRLRDNGYRATKVTDVRTGKVMAFSQSGGYLTILGIADWDPYDTVFKVETDGRQQSYYPQNSLRATASSAATGHPATDVVDGSHENYWDSDGKLPTSVTIDLGSRRKATSLAVNQREWSPTHARSTFGRPEDSARIKDYSVSTSDDGRHWRTVRTGALPSARGVQFIDIGERTARYLKLEVRNTWAGPQAPDFFGRLRIDEIKVAHGAPVSGSAQVPLEAESRSNDRDGGVRPSACGACSGSSRLVGFGGGARNSVTFRDVTAAEAGNYRLQFDHTAGSATSLSVRVNGAAAIDVAVPAGNPDVPGSTAVSVPLVAGANTVQVFSRGARGPGLDRIAVGPLPPTSYVPKTTMTVDPHGLQWVGAGQQSIKVTAKLRLDADDILDGVRLAPKVPAGWSVEGDPATASSMRLGKTLEASWTLTSPPGADVASTTVPVTAAFLTLGTPHEVTQSVGVRPRPADRVFMREAEDSRNTLGTAGLTGCSPCSGGEKVRNIGGSAAADVRFPDVTVDRAGTYTLFIDYTVNGDRSFLVSVNGGAPIEAAVSGIGNSTPATTIVPVTLAAGANTIRIYNDEESAPDLDRLSLGQP
ncbi:alpha-L-fucosidase [Streptomyces sp. NBC_01318]|uniref:alpha-L-fucosidase n=1 Tax=Streptomyces sp. NBC_01318 TaxID=2903823 RepID=UPI003FA382DE